MKTIYGIVNITETAVKCIFCSIQIERNTAIIDKHVSEEDHKENASLVEENGISFSDENNLYCKPCKKLLSPSESISQHVDGEMHATWIAAISELIENEYLDVTGYLSSEASNDVLFCEACDDGFLFSLPNVETHVNGASHRAKVVEKLKPLNGIFKVANDFEVWCKVCDDYIDSSVTEVFLHIDEDETHNEWLYNIDQLINKENVSIDEYLANEHEQNAYCSKCDVKILCNIEKLAEHINSNQHTT